MPVQKADQAAIANDRLLAQCPSLHLVGFVGHHTETRSEQLAM